MPPVASGRRKIFGLPGVKKATYVPSPRYPDANALVETWREARYGKGGWGYVGPENLLREQHGPWKPERTDASNTPCRAARVGMGSERGTLRYCCATFRQWPATFNPMAAGFGVSAHHIDTRFYDVQCRPGYVTERISHHTQRWHAERS